jgi:hypothetical protein
VRNLLLGPQRYSDLQDGLPGVTTNMLADRLRGMAADGLVVKRAGRWALTDRGRELEPVVLALGAFGQRELADGPRPEDRVDIRWGMVSLKRRYRGTARGTVRLCLERTFWVSYGPAGVEVLEQDLPAELTLTGDLPPWLFRGAPFSGSAEGEGLERFCSAFGLAGP